MPTVTSASDATRAPEMPSRAVQDKVIPRRMGDASATQIRKRPSLGKAMRFAIEPPHENRSGSQGPSAFLYVGACVATTILAMSCRAEHGDANRPPVSSDLDRSASAQPASIDASSSPPQATLDGSWP